MIEKTFVYGDSFSNHEFANKLDPSIKRTDMWYNHIAVGDIIDRTKPGKSPYTMFLQATHDAITNTDPVRMIVALGACQRLSAYTDGWYDEETLKDVDPNTPLPDPARKTTLTDCEPHLDRAEVNKENMSQFHPTLLWASIYKHTLDLALRCDTQGHQLIILHMNTTPDNTWINRSHPLISPLCERAEALPNYVTEHESCNHLCRQQGIRPMDYHTYGWHGHHGHDGQRYFGTYIADTYIAEKRLWN